MRTQLLWLATKPKARAFFPAVLVYCTVVVSRTEKTGADGEGGPLRSTDGRWFLKPLPAPVDSDDPRAEREINFYTVRLHCSALPYIILQARALNSTRARTSSLSVTLFPANLTTPRTSACAASPPGCLLSTELSATLLLGRGISVSVTPPAGCASLASQTSKCVLSFPGA